MKHQYTWLALPISLAITTMPALAGQDEKSFFTKTFIGTSIGYQQGQDKTYDYTSPSGILYQFNGGVQFSENWRWNLGYQYHGELQTHDKSITVSTKMLESSFQYDWPINNYFYLYGRLGLAYWDMKKTQSAQSAQSTLNAKGLSPLGEIGMKYRATSNVALSLGYQYIDAIGDSDTGQYDSHGMALGISYTFSNKQISMFNSTSPQRDAFNDNNDKLVPIAFHSSEHGQTPPHSRLRSPFSM